MCKGERQPGSSGTTVPWKQHQMPRDLGFQKKLASRYYASRGCSLRRNNGMWCKMKMQSQAQAGNLAGMARAARAVGGT